MAWSDVGGTVALFPEGRFSWDGSPSPLMPGIEQLILYLNVPVVTVSLSNGHKVKPAWAKVYRKTSIHLEVFPGMKFTKDDKIQEIIKNKIFSFHTNNTLHDFEANGNNLSAGLSHHLRFCPNCYHDNSLKKIAMKLTAYRVTQH